MDPAFDPPKGDAGSLSTSIARLRGIAKGLDSDKGAVTSAVQTAVAEWNGKRQRDFERAGGGLQLQVGNAAIAVGEMADALQTFQRKLSSVTTEIAGYRSAAEKLQATANAPDNGTNPMAAQHAAQGLHQLISLARQAHHDLQTTATSVAGRLDGVTGSLVKSPQKLSPSEIARQVRTADGVGSYGVDATLTPGQAWGVLRHSIDAAPEDVVRQNGTIDWAAVAGWATAPPGIATTPSALWAFGQLMKYALDGRHVNPDLMHIYSDVVSSRALQFDRGETTLDEVTLAYDKFLHLKGVYQSFRAGQKAEALEAVKDGGLTKTLDLLHLPNAAGIAKWGGRGLGVVGMAADVYTFFNPGTKEDGLAPWEIDANKWGSAANFVGTAAALSAPALASGATALASAGLSDGALVAVNAAADGIPVLGEVVMVGTGLYLAGDFLYHTWKPFRDVVNGAVDDAKKAWNGATHALASGWHDVTSWL